MIDRENEIVTCDVENCRSSESFDPAFFTTSMQKIKKLGWKALKTIDGWMHECPRHGK